MHTCMYHFTWETNRVYIAYERSTDKYLTRLFSISVFDWGRRFSFLLFLAIRQDYNSFADFHKEFYEQDLSKRSIAL